ncbi:MAG: hypothetical protein KDA92_00250 [Planctomycetales bacterium]|nr:hypothetical protein [Planctomycetales bacterium]
MATVGVATANFVEIDFRDQNLPTSAFPDHGGPHWVGVVDTLADTVTISFWEEIEGSTPYWTPNLQTSGPLVWQAVDLNGFRYDVPDDFGSNPHIGSNWGFISPVSVRNMVWNEGIILLPEVADFFPGWGAVRRPIPGQNPPELFYDTADNQQTMPLLPYSSVGTRPALQATVSVKAITIVGVPEPSAAACGLVVAGMCAGGVVLKRWRKK